MGIFVSRQIRAWFGTKPMKICMVGLDGAGKTTVLMKLHLGETVCTIPTIGFNVEKVQYKNLTMTIWDVGGQARLRPLWHHYYNGVDAVIFVIDSNDTERLNDVGQELERCLLDDQLRGVPFLIYANKQDLPHAASVTEISQKLRLQKLVGRQWYVQGCCAVAGTGIVEGLDWLSKATVERD